MVIVDVELFVIESPSASLKEEAEDWLVQIACTCFL